ncbi:TatD family hydrolase [Sulfurimonas sp. MAG313]|nr:TatD family hydrolase [Sulfurimonas sp. MAG313]MDF1880575.1 TatD family hydrolase [Sulfurimonas sp. MAG313]
MIIDTHIHLDNEQYYDDLKEVLTRARQGGVERFIIPGADPKDLKRAKKLAHEHEDIFFSVGMHPYDIKNFSEELIREYSKDEKCVAIGECGLDYFRLPEDEQEKEDEIALQKEVFRAHIRLANELNKPLIVHIRNASSDARKILEEEKSQGGVLHCYNADDELLPLAKIGFYFGIGGVLTFKNARKLVEVLPKIPKDRLLIETDGPYLTPHPYRGKRNEPFYTTLVAEKICELLDEDLEYISTLTSKNAQSLFGLDI